MLPIAPPELVEDVLLIALEDVEEIAIDTTAFADYVTEYWVERNNRQHWNISATKDHAPTTTKRDGTAISRSTPTMHAHPKICILIAILKKTQANTEANWIQVDQLSTLKERFFSR